MATHSVEDSHVTQLVRAVISDWRNAVNAGDIDRILRIAADDLEMMPPGQSALVGAEAHDFLRGFVSQFTADLKPFTNEEVIVCGAWAFQRYSYELTLTPKMGGEPITERGDGIHMFRRDESGSWRLSKDIFTSLASAPAET